MGDSLRYRVKVALKNISNRLSSYLHVDGTSNKNILPLNCLFETCKNMTVKNRLFKVQPIHCMRFITTTNLPDTTK
jgi:hypothetical protein